MDSIKRIKNKDYTTISNVFLKDKELSLKAKGLLSVVMALPDEWNFTIKGMVGMLKEGKSVVYSAIDELKEHKYCIVETLRNEKGVIIGTGYSFYEHPHSENPCTENPCTENRDMGKEENKEKVSPIPPLKEIKEEKIKKEEKENIYLKEKEKSELTVAENMEKRKVKFYNELIPFVNIYGKEMMREFFDYWTEPNKSKTKMKFELQPTWDTKRRLSTWSKRSNEIKQRNTYYERKYESPIERRERERREREADNARTDQEFLEHIYQELLRGDEPREELPF